MTQDQQISTDALIVGGGPAGLMAAEVLLQRGFSVLLADAKPSLGRKFLMAGKSGLNLTKDEDPDAFLRAYGDSAGFIAPMVRSFGPVEVQDWARELGQELFTGSSGRVFPVVMKASPLLRAWIGRLTAAGLQVRTRWHWTGMNARTHSFDTADGRCTVHATTAILAMGGASWAKLGSDGQWAKAFKDAGLATVPFAPSNAGLLVKWSSHMSPHFGTPLKNIVLSCGDLRQRGEIVISARGLEGGGLYPLGPALRSNAPLFIDLAPDLSAGELTSRLARPRGKQSMSNHLRKVTKLPPQGIALLREMAHPLPDAPAALAALIKALPISADGLRPIDEAISTVGGVPIQALGADLMLKDCPGVFCAGEMIDWDAPTGGYLLTGCLASGKWAGEHAVDFLQRQ